MDETEVVRFMSIKEIKAVVLAGVIAETMFELYTWFVSPILFDQVLQPSNLVIAIARMTLGIDLPHGAAFAVHALIGSVGFATYVYLVRRIRKLTFPIAGQLTGVLQ